MSVKSTVLQLREGHNISAPPPGNEHNLTASAQAVDGKKHLVPRKISALTRHLFEVATVGSVHEVDYNIFYGSMLCHAPPFGEQNALLQE